MKNKKLLGVLGVAALLLAGNFALQEAKEVDAATTPETLYLKPNSNWTQANARFAAYFFGNGETWVSMEDSNGDGIYEVTVPTSKTYPSIIFCRMNPSTSANNWNNKWDQTNDLTIPTDGKNMYTVAAGAWSKGSGSWSTYTYVAPEYYLMGTMTDWGTGAKMEENKGVYTVTLNDVPTGEQKFKLKTEDNWYGTGAFAVKGDITLGNADNDGNCVFTSEGGNYTFEYTLSSKVLNVTHTSYAELNSELNLLLTEYYNNGSYTRETTINLTEKTANELVSCFHAGNIVANRTTVFEGGSLWMTNEAGTYSFYGTDGENMTGGRVANVGETVSTVALKGVGGMEGYYTTMNDIKDSTNVKWTKSGNVWSCEDAGVIQQFLDFTAPCFLGLDDEHANYFSLSHVEVEKTADGLELRLVCSSVEEGKFEAGSGNVLSKAVISFE